MSCHLQFNSFFILNEGMVVAATALAVAAAVSALSFSLLYSFALALHLFFSFVFFSLTVCERLLLMPLF